MEGYDPLTVFGPGRAELYDADLRGDEDDTVAFLESIAHGGPALELAIGTGRIALPLAARGIRVDGIESSPAMIDVLRRKPGGDALQVTVGDMADVGVPGEYSLVFLVYNTLFNLLTQDDQVRCFRNVAEHLTDDGSFVVEAIVPSFLHRLDRGQQVDAEEVGVHEAWLDVGRHDPVAQRLDEVHVRVTEEGILLQPIVARYAWPSELDLMAQLAGLRLHGRWGGWKQEQFDAGSERHVSVYGR